MSLTRALAWNTGVQIAGKALSTALGVVIVGFMTRLLGQEGFGAYSTALAYLQIFALLLDLGLNVTIVALLGEHAGDKAYENRCIRALFTLRIMMAAAVLGILAPLVAVFLPYPMELKLAIFILAGSMFFPMLNQIVIGVQQSRLAMSAAAVSENAGRLVLLGGLIAARVYGWGLLPIMAFVTVGSFMNFLLNFRFARRLVSFRFSWDPEFWKSALSRSWPIGLSIVFNLVYFKADTFILSLVRSQEEVGIYGAAYRVLEILITVPFMYAGVLLPLLANAWAKRDLTRYGHLMSRSTDLMFLLVLPLVAGTWLLGNRIMVAVTGPDFAASGDVLKILVIAIAIIYLNVVFAHGVVAKDAQRSMLIAYALVAVVTLAGYIVFIPRYGMWAAAWLTVFSEICITLASLAVSLKDSPIPFGWRTPAAALGATVVMSAVVWRLEHMSVALAVLAGAAVYAATVYALGGVKKETLTEIFALRRGPPAVTPPIT